MKKLDDWTFIPEMIVSFGAVGVRSARAWAIEGRPRLAKRAKNATLQG